MSTSTKATLPDAAETLRLHDAKAATACMSDEEWEVAIQSVWDKAETVDELCRLAREAHEVVRSLGSCDRYVNGTADPKEADVGRENEAWR